MVTRRFHSVAVFTFCAACLGGAAIAQRSDSEQRVTIEPRVRAAPALKEIHQATFRMDVKLIQIPVTVTDLRDRPVMGLQKDRFRIFEDDVEQQIASFSMGDGAVSTGVVFDSSGSMRNRMEESRQAVEQFLQSTVPGDEFFLVQFSDSPHLLAPFTPVPDEISKHLSAARSHGWTAMNDALFLAVKEMRKAANPRRVLLVLTDGVDNNSRYSDSEVASLMREAAAGVFAIGLFERPRLLEKLADDTGGKVIWVHKMSELPDAMDKLSTEIRNQYVIGYFSDHAVNDGRYHKVRVELHPPADAGQVRLSWRKGYVAP